MSWEKVKLGDVAESCLGKMLDQEKNKGEYQPYLANLNVRWGAFDLDDLPEMKFEEHEQERYGLKYGDLVICEGGEPGRCAIWKDQISNMKIQKALHRVRVNADMDYRYLFYWFLLAGKNNALDQYFTGATIKHMPGQKLKQIVIDKPPIEMQKKIADILSAYDDLIENNQKQIKLLEEAAQRLYKEWFIDLHFPNHESTPIIDGIPQGWKKVLLGDIDCSLESGLRPKGGIDNNLSCGIPSVGAENVIGLGKYNYNSEKIISQEFFERMNRGKIKNKDILIYKDGAYIGRTSLFQDGFPHSIATVNEHVFLLHSNDKELQYYLFFTLYQKEYFYKMQKHNKNAAQPGLNQKALMSLDLILPTQELIIRFNHLVNPLLSKLFSCAKQNKQLTEARDRLLPKLMNGAIEVGMDKQKTVKIDKFENIRKHWQNVPYDEDLPLAARSTGDISEETLEKLKEIAEEE